MVGRLSARFARIRVTDTQTDRQTHKTTAVSLAAHARRGLKIATAPEFTHALCSPEIKFHAGPGVLVSTPSIEFRKALETLENHTRKDYYKEVVATIVRLTAT